ncbi:hypothetical protein HAX54_031077 [Datura stramonium]|uniref:Uncharacterized protein n=1 Tax=Datura stramonium TaxID=4076 RepID=A0ABS8SBP9_DATST|nr:hypothetical protein [Datura stramonium]
MCQPMKPPDEWKVIDVMVGEEEKENDLELCDKPPMSDNYAGRLYYEQCGRKQGMGDYVEAMKRRLYL